MNLVFELFTHPVARVVVLGVVLIAAASALIGCFLFLRKTSLVGDAIAHASLPGVCAAFVVFESRHPAILLLGAMVSGWLSMQLINTILRRTKLKADVAIGIALSWLFGIGIVMLTAIQQSALPNQNGLDHFLFGNAAGMQWREVLTFGAFAVVLITFVFLLYRPWKLMLFDRAHAEAIGLPVRWLEAALSLLTVLAVAIGIQTVGVVLMAALLITPAAAARFWTHRLPIMLVLAVVFSVVSGLVGTGFSYAVPRMPTGPWMVLMMSVLAVMSFLFGTRKGLLPLWWKGQAIKKKIARENVLKLLYQLGEHGDHAAFQTRDAMINRRQLAASELSRSLGELKRKGLVEQAGYGFRLTAKGLEEGARVVRLHRLWEMYLTQYAKIAPDHVHDDAEAMEHLITPELEAELVKLLNNPETDPHNSRIPYPKQP